MDNRSTPGQPDKGPSPTNGRSFMARGVMRADSIVEIALVLPLSTLVGWGLGEMLGRPWHATWPAIVGVILGAIAGFVQILRLVDRLNRNMQ